MCIFVLTIIVFSQTVVVRHFLKNLSMKKIILVLILFFTKGFVKAQCWKVISNGGYSNNTAIKTDSTFWSWENFYFNYSISDTQHTWVSVTAGWNHNLAIKSDGTLWAWGANNSGQFGNGTFITGNVDSPIQIGLETNWKSISAGNEFSLAIKNDGTLWAWGYNSAGQLGNNTQSFQNSPLQIGTDHNWKTISAGGNYSLAIKNDGTLWGWGVVYFSFLSLVPIQIDSSTNWESISASYSNSLAIKTDSTLWGWGRDDGSLGLGLDSIWRIKITRIGTDTDWKFASAGGSHSLAIKTNNTLWSSGDNTYGELGDGTNINKSSFTQIGANHNWQSISAGTQYSHAIQTDGTLWAWGFNQNGQLGDGSFINKNSPVQILCLGNPLPIKLLYFNAKLNGATSRLTWQTAEELSNKEYQIERSNNGLTFNTLAIVKSANSPNGSNYSYVDARPQSGYNYYRLRSVDFNGKYAYSDTRLLVFNLTTNSVKVYPIPANDILFIESNFEGKKLIITLIDNVGSKVFQVDHLNNKLLKISIASLNKGVYHLYVSDGVSIVTKKIFKE